MHPRDLGPYALQLRRLLVLACVLVAICITLLSGPQLLPSSASTIDLAQWGVYSPNLILPLVAGACAGVAAVRSIATRRRAHTPADTAWFLIVRIYLGCYLALIVACALLPAVNLSSPVPPVYFEAIVSDTNPVLALYPLASFSCVAVLSGRDTAAYLTAIAPLQVLAMMAADPSIKLSDAIMGPIYFLLVAMVNAGMLHWTLTIAHGLDRTQRSAREAERALAVERARGHARARSNGLIHDYVLAALILAITRGVDEAEVRAAADVALSALVPAPPSDGTVDAVQVRGALAALVGPRRPHWTFECRLPKDGWNIPAQVASALAGATHEALNNVRLHAGADTSDPSAPARCRVTLTAGGDFVRVTIIDVGRGFDATRLSEGRHGVRDSIVNRMKSVGGRATLTSRPGGGTRVILEWIDPHKRWLRPREAIRTALTRRQRGAGVGAKDQSRIAWDSQVRAAAESRGARALVLAGIAVHAYILVVEISHGAYTHVAPPVLALALIAVAGASLVARWADRVPPAAVTWGSAAAIGAANLLVLPLVRGASQWPGWSGWSAGASMFLAALLLVRQRQAEAIAGCAAFVAAVAAWVAIQGRTPLLVFTFTIGHILTFMLWFGLVEWSGSATSSIERSLKDEGQARLERELQVATNTAMAVKLADVSVRARGTLQAIRDRELTDGLVMEARLLEAELRDEIRAPFFTGTAVVDAARRARERGVEVLLYDDRGGKGHLGSGDGGDELLRSCIVDRATSALDEAVAGRVVVRVCPPARRWAATILSDAGLSVVEAEESTAEAGKEVLRM